MFDDGAAILGIAGMDGVFLQLFTAVFLRIAVMYDGLLVLLVYV